MSWHSSYITNMSVIQWKRSLNIITKDTIRFLSSQRSFEEIQIPTPWGHLAGKWWTPHDKRPILAFHGWQDNAGSFDRLIPYLPANLGVLALDFPGHGLSSQLPKGLFYHSIDSISLYKRILKYFNWDKVSLMGHSLGVNCNLPYAVLYPDEVDILICLDGFFFLSKTRAKPEKMAKTIDAFLKYDAVNNSSAEPPCYTLEELKQRMHIGSNKSIELEPTKYILQRNTVPVKNNPSRFYTNRDLRLKVGLISQWSADMLSTGLTRIKCPLFVSIGKYGLFSLKQLVNIRNSFKIVEKYNKNCYLYEVEGTHHVHINNPEILAGPINEFLIKHYLTTSTKKPL